MSDSLLIARRAHSPLNRHFLRPSSSRSTACRQVGGRGDDIQAEAEQRHAF